MKLKRFFTIFFITLVFLGSINAIGLWGLIIFNKYKLQSMASYKINDVKLREDLSGAQLHDRTDPTILFLGNSVVWGEQVLDRSNTFVGLIDKKMAADATLKTLHTVNGGQAGSNIWYEFELAEKQLISKNTKAVVWVVSTNDFISHADAQKNNEEKDLLKVTNSELTLHSLLKDNFFKKIEQIGLVLYQEKVVGIDSVGKSDTYYMNRMIEPLKDNLLKELSSRIEEFHSYLNKRDIKMLVLFLPSRAFLRTYQWKDAKAYLQIEEILNSLKIDNLQLVDEMKTDCADRCFADFVHLNPAGHQFVADKLFVSLQKENLVSSKP